MNEMNARIATQVVNTVDKTQSDDAQMGQAMILIAQLGAHVMSADETLEVLKAVKEGLVIAKTMIEEFGVKPEDVVMVCEGVAGPGLGRAVTIDPEGM